MSPDEIISQLMRTQPKLPDKALQAADTQRAELTPRLLASLVEVVANPGLLERDGELQLPFYAMYLLAAWREQQAHPLLLGFLRLPGDQCVDLAGDIVTEDMDRLLAQTAGGDLRGIVALAGDPSGNEWARGAAIKALSCLAAWGELPRVELIALYRGLIATHSPPSKTGDQDVMDDVLHCALDLQLVEMRGELLELVDHGWINNSFVGSREEIAAEFDEPPVHSPYPPITDVAVAVSWWACFEDEEEYPTLPPEPEIEPVVTHASWDDGGQPKPYRAPPKIGRNEPCPCGSGKKYKKCCGR